MFFGVFCLRTLEDSCSSPFFVSPPVYCEKLFGTRKKGNLAIQTLLAKAFSQRKSSRCLIFMEQDASNS